MSNLSYCQEPADDDCEAIFARLREVIAATQLDLVSFAEQSGIPYPSLRDYASGRRKPGLAATVAMLRFTGVSADWLLLGQGERGQRPEAQAPMGQRWHSQVDRALLHHYQAMEDCYLEFEECVRPAYGSWTAFALCVYERLAVWELQARNTLALLSAGNPIAVSRILPSFASTHC